MNETKEITPTEYAKYLGCTSQNVSKHIRNNKLEYLPDVISIKKYSRFYLLVVPYSFGVNRLI